MGTQNLRLEWLDPKTLKPNPYNWRQHPAGQKKILDAVMSEVGNAGAALFNEQTGRLLDGHLRRERAIEKGEKEIPVLVGSWSEADEKKILATLDPIAAMAEQADALYRELLEGMETESEDLRSWADGLLEELGSVGSDDGSQKDSNPNPPLLQSASLDDLAPTDEERAFFEGRHIVVQCSGGKDSTGSLMWAKRHFPDHPTSIWYVDLGADWPGFLPHMFELADFAGLDLTVLRPDIGVIEMLYREGKWPHWRSPWCQSKCLFAVFNERLKAEFVPDSVVVIRGGRVSERSGMNKGKNVRETRFQPVPDMKKWAFFNPLYFADKESGERILAETGAPLWSGYTYGLQRTACRICPGQNRPAYAAIRANFPHVWDELLHLERKFGATAWQGHDGDGIEYSFTEMADRGQQKFEEGGYAKK